MLNCLTYIAFVYWAVATVHTVLPIDVAVCGADVSRGGLGALFHHAFGGDLDVDVESWRGFPCKSGLLTKLGFILRRPAATVRHIMYGGGQDELIVPILSIVPIIFATVVLLRHLGLRLMSEAAAQTLLKFGIAIGCRSMILLQSLVNPTKESVYFKRYSKMEFCIIAWTAYIIELPVWHEALVSGGTAVLILLLCTLFPHHMLPEVNPVNVATQAVAAAALGVGHAYYQQRRRIAERATGAARIIAKAAAAAEEEERKEQGGEDNQRPKQQQDLETQVQAGALAGPGASTSASTPPEAAAENVRNVRKAVDTSGDDATGSSAPPISVSRTAVAAGVAAASSSASASIAVLRRLHAASGRSYVSPARLCRVSMKVRHAHLSDLPANMMAVINSEVLAGSGWQAISAHAREGCVELVLDLRPLVAIRPSSYRNSDALDDDRLAQPDQDQADGAASGGGGEDDGAADAAAAVLMGTDSLRELGRSIVSYLQSTGAIRPERERSVVLQLGTDTVTLTWQLDTQSWVVMEAADGESLSATAAVMPPPNLPTLQHISPRVVLWQGARLHLNTVIAGPSVEEVLAGGGLVVRCGACPLQYTVLHVRPHDTATPMTAAAGLPQPLLVDLAVSGAPSSGLLLVEARTSAGLLSAPAAVVVHHDTLVVSGLAALAAAMDDASADAMLTDYGSWLDLAMARTMAAATSELQRDDDIAAGGDGGKGVADKAAATAVVADSVVQGTFSGARFAGGVLAAPSAAAAGASSSSSPCCRHRDVPHQEELPDRACSGGGGGGGNSMSKAMLTVAADLLGVCCRGSGAGGSPAATAIAAVADHLIACVVACADVRPPAEVFLELMDAVPVPPVRAGALHMAVAAGMRPVVEVIVGWYDKVCGGATVKELWLSRAACGVTPLHVAATMPDGGAMAAWLLSKYDTAAVMWDAAEAASDDGLTPAALAAQLGSRWWLLPWRRVSGVVRAVKRALTPPAPLGHAVELLWGFRDPPLERRFVEALSGQSVTALALYAAANALLSLLALVKAILYGNFETTTALVALAFHVPQAAPLLAWICQNGNGRGRGSSSNSCPQDNGDWGDASASASAVINQTTSETTQKLLSSEAPPRPCQPRPYLSSWRDIPPPSAVSSLCGRCHPHAMCCCPVPPPPPARGIRAGSRRLRIAMLVMHVCRAATKAAVGLSLWPFSLPGGAEVFLARGGDIALEAVVRPVLEQVSLPTRLLVSLVDVPAMLLLYRGLERKHPGLVPWWPLKRVVLYQAVLLATTAAVSATSRVRFLRTLETRTTGGVGATAAAESSVSPSSMAPYRDSGGGSGGGSGSSSLGKAVGGRPRVSGRAPVGSDCGGSGGGGGGGGGKRLELHSDGGGSARKSLRGDDQ